MKIVAFGFAVCAALLAGCASTSPQTWNDRRGHYSEAQAVQDMGAPRNTVPLADGSQVDTWLYRSGSRNMLMNDNFYAPALAVTGPWEEYYLTRSAPYIPEVYLRLLFGPDGKLEAWDRPMQ